MPCPRETSRLSAWLDGELESTLAAELEAHVSGCPTCRELASALREIRGALAPELGPDPGFLVRFRERRDQISVAPFWTWRQFALRLIPVAGAVLVAALLTVLLSAGEEVEPLAFELEALGSATAFMTPGSAEPVLSIALEPFPLDQP